ncbi:MAG: type II toxin-antitoxin system VapC family toxin [Gemmatimonadetes bacterium]|nr:type II toxin-antitoxin system VapC family toxin [Gemmatimonadota bacterium]
MTPEPLPIRSAYFDSAYVLKCYVPEADSAPVRALALRVPRLVTSELARAEFASALHRRVREGRCSPEEADVCGEQFAQDIQRGVWHLVPCADPVWERVAAVFRTLPPSTCLRSADAIHLASAALAGEAVVYSSDRQLVGAAIAFGVRAERLTAPAPP